MICVGIFWTTSVVLTITSTFKFVELKSEGKDKKYKTSDFVFHTVFYLHRSTKSKI